uniref:Fucosyltransferase n=1 Tax=Sander lucioperca TaxID=283035 RepID=A0A8C9YYF3_SANLU
MLSQPMSSSACQWTLHPFAVRSLLVLCFLGLFFMYNKTDIKFPNFGIYMEKGCQFCPTVLCAARAQTQDSQPNLDAEPDTIVLIWMWPFGARYDLSCNTFHITRCHLTDDKTLYHKAHGVLFHHRDIHGNLGDFPKDNWNMQYERIHFYGNAFGRHISDQYSKIVSSCKFYLSFENSVYKDYITEKLYLPMMKESVPIVLGPSRQNYEDHIPADSFIHVNDFSTAKELAEKLLYLDQNNSLIITEYIRYFNWIGRFKVKLSWFGKEHTCKTCSYLQNHREYQAFHDLNKWYWG